MTSDGDYIASGTTKSFGSGKDFNAWLVKILDYDNQRPNKPDTSEEKQNGKPGTNYTYTSSCLEPGREVLFYI